MSLFEYPSKAHFGRVLPKSKIYQYAGASARLKELFVRDVDQVVWKYKLAPETINVPPGKAVMEIQIFHIVLRTRDLKEDVLRSIDKAIPFPVIYELSYGGKTRAVAAFKRPNESDSSKWVVRSYFATDWISDSIPRKTLPVKLDLSSLYEALLRTLIPYPAKGAESLDDQLQRAETIRSRELELARAETALRKEKQFNRKVEINASIRSIKHDIQQLITGNKR